MKFRAILNFDLFFMKLYLAMLVFIRRVTFLKMQYDLRKNKELLNIRTGSTCSILGLGPSLNSHEIEDLSGDIIVVNRFIYSKFSSIEPTIVIFLDEKFFKEYLDILLRTFETYKRSKFILNYKYHKLLPDKIRSSNNVYFVAPWKGLVTKKMKLNLCKEIPIMPNVILSAIYISMALGYDEIKLFGVDFNLFCELRQSHCYADDYVDDYSLTDNLFLYSFVSHFHEELNAYANINSIRINNMNEDSLLQSYNKRR